MRPFDPRVTPVRADLAAKELQGKVAAPRYTEGSRYEIIAAQTPVRSEPRPDAPLATEALRGERVTVYDINSEGWAWGQLTADGYVGWLGESAIKPAGQQPTHKVMALRTLVFPGPSIKQYEADFVAVAERFVGAPYLWGGKTVLGLDCSGLVQVALAACGIASPRDSDMQEAALGVPIRVASGLADPQRGDLIFWEDHVAVVRDRTNLIHANAFHMAVAIEPISQAVERIRASG